MKCAMPGKWRWSISTKCSFSSRAPCEITKSNMGSDPIKVRCVGTHRAHRAHPSPLQPKKAPRRFLVSRPGGSLARDPDVPAGAVSGFGVKSSPTALHRSVRVSRVQLNVRFRTRPRSWASSLICHVDQVPKALVRQSCAPLYALFPDTSFGTGRAAHSSDSPAFTRRHSHAARDHER